MAGKRNRHNRNRRGSLDESHDENLDEYDENSDGFESKRPRRVISYNEEDGEDEDEEEKNYNNPNDENTGADEEGLSTSRRTRYKFTNDEEQNDEPIDDVEGANVSSASEEVKDDNEEEYVEDDEDEDDDNITQRRRRPRRAQVSDESDFQDSASEASDDFLEKLQEKNFIASEDDDDEDNNYGYTKRSKRSRRLRSRSKSVEPRRRGRSAKVILDEDNEANESAEEEDSIQKEIDELYDSSPNNTPMKHKLRERDNKVDYTIPPPMTNEAHADPYSAGPIIPPFSRGRGRKPTNIKNEYRKILFPTAGPFGGSDVISLFGTNIPPGGIPIPGMTNDNNLTAIGQNVSDSDSSEDEIAPINGEATVSKKISKPVNNANNGTHLITGGSSDSKDRKKNNLSDTDPLGVDMNIDFSVVGGLDNYINQLKEMVALPLLYPELYQNFGITPPRGVLFHGPPGTGKTLMARALAASCSTSQQKITFFMRKGADCLSKWVGEAERQLRLLFEEAKNQQPAIIFFDEIDGLAPVRSSKQEQIHASIVSTLLALMDGMDNRGQVIVIGATNRPDSVDPALRRPGRFDREFYFPLPDINARKEILQIHTRKWTPPLSEEFTNKVAELTKGYGGADLRALCTEAALNSIQRKYPQIYKTNDKLQVDPSKIKVVAKDFMRAIEKIVPSSARSTSSGSAPLPNHLKPLLEVPLAEITDKLNDLLPNSISVGNKKKLTTLDEALYLDPTAKDSDGGFSKQELLKSLENSRICKPHLLICGNQGSGQQYISAAILNYLEGFQVQSLDMGNMFGDPTRTPELSIVQAFIEARRHQPSIVFIPNIDIWFKVVPYTAQATLNGLLRSLKSNEKVLLLAVSETSMDNLDPEIKSIFGFNNSANNVALNNPSRKERLKYFKTLKNTLLMKPYEFVNDLENRPRRKLKTLKVVPSIKNENAEVLTKKKLKQIEYDDTKLKNILKIKLAGLMDLFKNRYKRFRKPVVDEAFLYHLFEPSILQNPLNNYEVLYVKSDDPDKENMIKEISTGKYYYNMDLDIIEERLWNGYYSEPKQFLKDIKMIVKDSITSGDRERILKANEMLTNAQFGIDDFCNPDFVKACKEMRNREVEKQSKILKEHQKLEAEFRKKQLQNIQNLTSLNGGSNETGASEAVPINVDVAESKQTQDGSIDIEMKLSEHLETSEKADVNCQDPTVVENGKILQDPENQANEQPDAESESEPEEELLIDPSRELIIPEEADTFFNRILPELTDSYNIENLEVAMARFMDIIWADRSTWDKGNTVSKLTESANSLSQLMSNGL
ncbi:uncharacterized protein AC631_04511 [Debaryomyces fabryi]|uniref:Bromo domain-containing protein n=1 Tax=Debaryomyces fabryi TaxID=58627 RepID=A0A0V1PU35_9ASCO|nr:uncharacterized protein AC631_04511 [Debaryomyces fabryi]KRZ99744.1 hypothetical protein AC631_04511 [Debaryomyces fabryi]CUM54410.1 unnamed protein product [Debaryomyces fabryi]